jgi:hypothetical protein
MWVVTIASETTSVAPISRLDSPSATSVRTSASRGVRSSGRLAGGGAGLAPSLAAWTSTLCHEVQHRLVPAAACTAREISAIPASLVR